MCDFDCAEKIAEYRMLWLKLGKLTEDLGNCMGYTYGAQVTLIIIISLKHICRRVVT
jgi:hypothetical protein